MSESAAAPAAAPAAPATPAPAAPAAPQWWSTLDSDNQGWVQNRGLHNKPIDQAMVDTIKQARELEKFRGVPAEKLMRWPDDPTQPGALDPILERLGRPKAPSEYQLPLEADGSDKDFAAQMAVKFHAAGLSQSQAEAAWKSFKELAVSVAAGEDEASTTAGAADMAALKTEWKDTYDLNVAIARQAVKGLNLDKATVDKIEEALGSSAAVIKLLNAVGQKGQEASFVSGSNAALGIGATTPEAARQRFNELKADPSFVQKWHAGDAPANKLVNDLLKVMGGQRP